MIGGPTIQSLPGTSNPTSCCELCSNPNLHPTCVGFSITANGTCLLKSSLNDGQQPESGALSGIVGNHSHFRVHYGNPYPSQAANNGTAACQGDEIVYEIGGGSFCSPACLVNETTGNLGACPSDKPAGMTANALCVLTDPIAGSSGHCALVCKSMMRIVVRRLAVSKHTARDFAFTPQTNWHTQSRWSMLTSKP
jgi:hypothetical protein